MSVVPPLARGRRPSWARFTATAATALLCSCARTFHASGTSWVAVDTARVAAIGVERVALSARQGPVRFQAAETDSIVVELKVGNALGAMRTTRECRYDRAPEIRVETSDRAVHVRLDQSLDDSCVTDWLVTVPARVAVEADVTAGNLTVQGSGGGVDLETAAGNIILSLGDGPVTARTGTGRVELSYTSDGYGSVDARTRVGSIQLWVDGRNLSHQRRPGSGDELQLGGKSENPVRLTVNVGSIEMRLGRAQ
jgi:hypothetical protein